MKILVVGLETHDAGKTTLCKALIHRCKKFDVNLVPFKPHSGICYWNQFNAFQDSLVRGSLLSSDIMELEEAAEHVIDQADEREHRSRRLQSATNK